MHELYILLVMGYEFADCTRGSVTPTSASVSHLRCIRLESQVSEEAAKRAGLSTSRRGSV